LVHPFQSLSILSLGTRMVMQINLHNKTIILQGRKWPIIVNIHAPHLDAQNARFLQKMHVHLVKHYKIKQ
jgi:hypothetical protein